MKTNRSLARRVTATALAAASFAAIGPGLINDHTASAAPAGCTNWVLSADTLTVRERDETLGVLGNDGDEPYLASVAVHTRAGAPGATKFWAQGADKEMDDDGKTGEVLNVPDKQGTVQYTGIQPGDVIAKATIVMENDNITSSVRASYRRAFDLMATRVGAAVAAEFEKVDSPNAVLARTARALSDASTANDAAAVAELEKYLGTTPNKLRDGLTQRLSRIRVGWSDVKKILGSDPFSIISNVIDPDGFGGVSVEVYVHTEPFRSLASNPLVPAFSRGEITKALNALGTPQRTAVAEGVQIVVGSLQDGVRTLSYSFDGKKALGPIGEHLDMDGRYEITHTSVGCPTGLVAPGQVHVNPMLADGKVNLSTYKAYSWTSGWVHNETYSIAGTSRLLLLKEANGRVDVDNLTSSGTITAGLGSTEWTRGWTNAQILDRAFGETPARVLYKRGDGRLTIATHFGADYGHNLLDTNVGRGWTTVEPYRAGNANFVLLYNSVTGVHRVYKVGTTPGGTPRLEDMGGSTWQQGWETVDTFVAGGTTRLYLHQPVSGQTKVYDLNASTGRISTLRQDSTTAVPKGSAAFGVDGRRIDAKATEFYVLGGKTFLFQVDRATGEWAVRNVSANGVVGAKVQSGRWTAGWTDAQVYVSGGKPFLFLYKSGV